MKINKKGIILIYVLVLINVALVMALMVLNNANILSDNASYQEIERELYQKISSKGNTYIKYQLSLNNDGSGFTDELRCPNSITMSGNTLRTTGITSQLVYTGSSFFCSGSYSSLPFNIFFNDDKTGFIAASYNNLTIGLITNATVMEGSSKFLDDDQTFMTFNISSYQGTDSYDDNFNSDDYRSNSTGSIEYLSPYLDNDDLGRKEIFGYITSSGVYENIFWNNFETNAYIDANPNNTGSLNQNISVIASGSMFFDVDKDFSLKIVVFDRNYYTKFSRELVQTGTYTSNGTILAGSGYIQNIGGVLSLTGGVDLNTTFLNFRDNDYAVFISNNSNSTLYYKFNAKNPQSKNVYINPINDSISNKIKYLGNHIITSSGNVYIGKQLEIFGLK